MSTPPRLLTGGNPQIAKGDGGAPVQAWIAAVPGWKSRVAADLDALIERAVPGVRKAVRWNSPFYGAPATDSWFLGLHATNKYLKLAFFQGRQLDPMPPVASKTQQTRYLHLFEQEPVDTAQLTGWLRQAAALDGIRL